MQLTVGSTTVTSVVEQPLTFVRHLLPDATREAVAEIGWLRPHFVDDEERMLGLVQTFVIEHEGAVIVVDTCVGDAKRIPGIDRWSHQTTGFLERFRAAGFDPDTVDLVLCTHMHMDHVGWNTTPDGEGGWVPTFPHARHLFDRTEFEHFVGEAEADPEAMDGCVMAESVGPIVAAGLHELVDAPCEVLPGIRLFPTPGHTPGHVSIEITSDGEAAVITGDALHHPCQIARPDWHATPDHDPPGASATRRALIARCRDTGARMIGTHFAEPVHGTVVPDGDGHRLLVDP